MMDFKCEKASKADLPFIMATERSDGYDATVGRWDETRHLAAIEDDHYAYFVASVDGAPAGFVIVRDWRSAERVTCVKRIAMTQPGNGHGRRLLRAVVDSIFRDTDAHRIWLGVFPDNERARRAYQAVGFKAEGVARGSAFFGGLHRDELIMAVLRPEWAAANAAPMGNEVKSP
jgi:RimJ/RimL family protein N-acetyltransferase